MKKFLGITVLVLAMVVISNRPALAISILSDYQYSGTPGNYLLDFSFTNNIPVQYGQTIYFLGVDLAHDSAQGSPSGWQYWGAAWDNQGYGGSNLFYPSNWITGSGTNAIAPGQTLSGFTVHSAVIPDSIHYYAFATGTPYYGDDANYKGWNPGFEGTIGENSGTNNVVPEPATMLLLGSGLVGAFLKKRRV